jgi:glycosyltransferase involved in cell wall biosynthesis
MISCIVLSYGCGDYIDSVLQSIESGLHDEDEVILYNRHGTIGKNRNFGAKLSSGDILLFADGDNMLSEGFIEGVRKISQDKDNAGGGCKNIIPTRKSLGILLYMLPAYIKCKLHHTGIGAFWVRRWVFDAIGGFSEDKDTLDDIDFAMRLKAFCRNNNMVYKNLESPLYWSTRKFDKLGDWHWIKNIFGYIMTIFTTRCSKRIQDMWYELPRDIF